MDGDAKEIDEGEVPMLAFGLMTEDEHGGVAAERAAKEGKQKQGFLFGAVGAFDGFLFVCAIGEESDDGEQDQIGPIDDEDDLFVGEIDVSENVHASYDTRFPSDW